MKNITGTFSISIDSIVFGISSFSGSKSNKLKIVSGGKQQFVDSVNEAVFDWMVSISRDKTAQFSSKRFHKLLLKNQTKTKFTRENIALQWVALYFRIIRPQTCAKPTNVHNFYTLTFYLCPANYMYSK